MQITIQQLPYNSTRSDSDHLERKGTLHQQAVKYKEVSSVQAASCTETEWSVCMYNHTMGVRGVTKWSMTGLLRYKTVYLGLGQLPTNNNA
jgi:hypothetical protein